MPELGLGDRHGSSYGERGFAKRLAALASHAPLQGDRLLDIGCGPGTYTVRLAAGFRRVDAVDVELERLQDFRESVAGTDLAERITVQAMSAEALEFADGVFDLVTAIEVLEHVPDLDGAVAEVRRVLRQGGRFAVTSPNRLFPFETHGVLLGGRRLPPWRMPGVTWIVPLHRRVSDARAFTMRGLTRTVERQRFRQIGETWLMPPFDRSRFGKRIRPLTDAMERSPLQVFGLTLAATFEAI